MPARHRAGKPGAAAAVNSSSSEDEDEASEAEQEEKTQETKPKARPAASSFPSGPGKSITSGVKDVKLTEEERKRFEDEFETESEDNDGKDEEEEESGSGSGSDSGSEEEESSEEESSSEDERARTRLKPVFIRKGQRKTENGTDGTVQSTASALLDEERKRQEEEADRKARTDAMIQDQLERTAAAKAEQKLYWDDDKDPADEVDDADGVDPEAELTAWKLREFRRVKRDRDAIIAAEKEREEVERRRNLTAEEREAEDREYLDAQKEERDGKGKMGFLQRYSHKGAFFSDDLKTAGLADRDVMGGRYADDVTDRSALPQFMQIRDMTKLGRKGRTRYKDMRNEDTGRFGEFGRRMPRNEDGGNDVRDLDDRYKPDDDRSGGFGATGANASNLGERKRPGEPHGDRDGKRTRVD
jgi:microfibrillar-associated protein 1